MARSITAEPLAAALASSHSPLARRASHLHELTGALASAHTPEDVARVFATEGVRVVGAVGVAIHRLVDDGTQLALLAMSGSGTQLEEKLRLLPLGMRLPITDAATGGALVHVSSRGELGVRYPLARSVELPGEALSCLPLLFESGPGGVLSLLFEHPLLLDDDDSALLSTVATICAQALERARLFEAERSARTSLARASRHSARLEAMTAALSREHGAGEVASVVVDQGRSATGALGGALWMLARAGQHLDLVHAAGDCDALRTFERLRLDDAAPIARAVRQAEALRVDGNLVCMSLVVEGCVTGGLAFVLERARAFDDEERAFLAVMAGHAAQALDRVRLDSAEHEAREAQRQSEQQLVELNRALVAQVSRVRALAEASRAFAAAGLDFETALDAIARHLATGVGDGCVVCLLADDGASLVPVAVAHREEARRASLQQAARTFGVAVPSDSRLVVPLRMQGKTLGLLGMVRDGEGAFSDDERALVQDLADRAAMSIESARRFAQARDAIRARDEFLTVASHELKTPVTSLNLQLETALRQTRQGGVEIARVEQRLEAALEQVQRLAHLIDSLLDVSNVSAGHLQLSRAPVDLTAVVRVVVERFHAEAAVEGTTLTVDVTGPVVGAWDRARLHQVVSNVVSNAVKYGAHRPVLISVTSTDASAVLRIEDHGIGIAPEQYGRVFNRFDSLVSARHFGGFGVGLWMTRKIVEALGGSIDFTSERGQGSTFVVTLPRHVARPMIDPATGRSRGGPIDDVSVERALDTAHAQLRVSELDAELAGMDDDVTSIAPFGPTSCTEPDASPM